MTDAKKIADNTEAQKPEQIADEALDDASGGYVYELKDLMISSYQTGGATADVTPEAELVGLKINTGDFEKSTMVSDVEKAGALRKRPTR